VGPEGGGTSQMGIGEKKKKPKSEKRCREAATQKGVAQGTGVVAMQCETSTARQGTRFEDKVELKENQKENEIKGEGGASVEGVRVENKKHKEHRRET